MPWGRLDDSLYDHQKLDDLPTDEPTLTRIIESLEPAQLVRLAAIGLWARSISWCNRFLTDGHVPRGRIDKLDGSRELADALAGVELYETDATGYRVHDFLEFNDSRADVLERREKETARQREWRKKKAASRNGVSHDVTANGSGHDVTASVTPVVTPSVTRFPARASRSANPGPARPGPADEESLPERIPDARPRSRRRADVQALLDRGWPKVTKAQRRVLDEVLERHDVTGPEFAAAAIRSTPPDKDPLEAVMTADRMWQASEKRKAEAEEQAANEERIAWLDGPRS